jgi:hypothetical protein
MKFINRKVLVVGALAAFAGSALVGPSVASAKTYKANWKVVKANPQVGIKISATYKGTPIGTCKMKGILQAPDTRQTITCKGGSFKLTAKGKIASVVTGTWKVSGGKGKFKGIKGSGKFSGKLSDNIFTYKGTLKY